MAYQRYIGRDYTAGNVTPASNASVSLGQPQKRWKEVYVDANSLHLGNVSFSIGKTNQLELMRTNKLGQPVANVVLANAVAKPLKVMDGGTGASTFTDGGVLLGSGAGAVTAMAVLTDGQMIVGDGTTDPVPESGDTLRNSIGVGSTASGTVMQVYSANASGNVSIGRSLAVGYTDGRVPQANLDVKGNAYITGATTIGGTLTPSTITTANSAIITGNLTPSTNVAFSLGQPAKAWKELWLDGNSLHLGNTSVSIGKTGEVEFMKTNKLGQPVTSVDVANVHASIDAGGVLTFYSANTTGNVRFARGAAIGYANSKVPGANLDVNGNAYISGATTIGGAATISGAATLSSTATVTGKLSATSVTPAFYGANVTGNVSVTRSLAVGYTDGRVPQANLDVKGNVYIGNDVFFSGANYDLLWDETTSKLKFYDSAQACFGDGNDLQIYHGGTHSFIKNSTGQLRIKGDDIRLRNKQDLITYIKADNSGGQSNVRIYHNDAERLVTTGTGITVSGIGANVAGNVSVTRSFAVGYTDGRVPQANLDVSGNAVISSTLAVSGTITSGGSALQTEGDVLAYAIALG